MKRWIFYGVSIIINLQLSAQIHADFGQWVLCSQIDPYCFKLSDPNFHPSYHHAKFGLLYFYIDRQKKSDDFEMIQRTPLKKLLDSTYYYNIDRSSGALEISSKTVIGYDQEGNYLYDISSDWSAGNQWVNNSKFEYIYDLLGKFKESYYYIWNKSNEKWEPNQRVFYKYNGQGRLIERSFFKFDQATWVPSVLYETSYSNSQNVIKLEIFNWNPDSLEYKINSRTIYSYDSLDRLSGQLQLRWHNDSNSLQNYLEVFYLYVGNRLTELNLNWWDLRTVQWLPGFKRLFGYNTDGYVLTTIVQEYDAVKMEYYNSILYLNIRDNENDILESQIEIWDPSSGKFIASSKYINFYSVHDIINGIKDEDQGNVACYIFPNPSDSRFRLALSGQKNTVSLLRMTVQNMDGKFLDSISFPDASNLEVDFTDYSAGVYLLYLNLDGENYTLKLIKN